MTSSVRSAIGSTRWAFDVTAWAPTEVQWLLATSCLQPEERDRISRFAFQRDAKSSLIGRLMMRKFVAENSDLQYDKIRFARDERGKPYLAGDVALSFNISHQGNYTVLAGELSSISFVARLGVDVMKLEYSGGKTLSEFFRVMTRTFSSVEWDHIKEPHDNDAKLMNFCRLWCLKESYLKATGTGITVDLQKISFSLRSPLQADSTCKDTSLCVEGVLLQDWTFYESLLDSDHCVSVAIQGDPSPQCLQKTFCLLSFDDLVQGCKPLAVPDLIGCRNFFKKDVSPRSRNERQKK